MPPTTDFPRSFVAQSVESKKTISKGKPKIHSERNVTVTLEYSASPSSFAAAGPTATTSATANGFHAHFPRLTFVTDRPCFPTLDNARRLEVDRPKLFASYTGASPDGQQLPVVWMSVKMPIGLTVMFAFARSDVVLRDRFHRLLMDFINAKELCLSASASSPTSAHASASASTLASTIGLGSTPKPPQFAYKDSASTTGSASSAAPPAAPRTRTRSAHSAEVALAAFHSSSAASSSPSRPAAAASCLTNPLKRPASPTHPPPPDLHDPIGGTSGTLPTASKRSRPNDGVPLGQPRPPIPPLSSLSALSALTNGASSTGYPLSPTPKSAAASLLTMGLSKPSSSGAMGAMEQFKYQSSSIKQQPTRRIAQGLARPAPSLSHVLGAPLAVPGASPATGTSSAYFEASRSRAGRGHVDPLFHQQQHHPIASRGRRGKRIGRGGRANGAFVSEFGDGPMDRLGTMGTATGVAEGMSGMRNNGNTCYQNALLVAFLATSPFMSIISRLAPIDQPLPPDLEGPFAGDLGGGTRSRPRSASVPPRSPSPSKDLMMDSPMDTRSDGGREDAPTKAPSRHELIKAIAAIAWKRERNPGQVIDPRPFTEGLLNLSSLFKRGEQADAQELLTECLAIMESESPPIGPNAVNLFQFTLAKRVQCDNCPYHSTMTEPHRGLSLEVAPATASTVVTPPLTSTLLQQYFAPERIEYKCERCRHPTASVKHFVHRPPQVLVLHLKRFQMMPTGQVRKKHEAVAIQEVVDLAPFAVPTGGELSSHPCSTSSAILDPPPTPQSSTSASLATGPPATPTIVSTAASPTSAPHSFKLTAVVNHLGQHARRGHYVCDMRDPSRPEQWLTFDDSHVSRLGPMSQLTHRRGQHGYLLFYVAERGADVPLGHCAPVTTSASAAYESTPLRAQPPRAPILTPPPPFPPVMDRLPRPMRTPRPSPTSGASLAAGEGMAQSMQMPVRPDQRAPVAKPPVPSSATKPVSPRKLFHPLESEQVGSPTRTRGPAGGSE